MKRTPSFFAIATLLFATSCKKNEEKTPAASSQLPATSASASAAPAAEPAPPGGLEHMELVTGGARVGDSLPLVIAIHGLGDKPQSFSSLFRTFEGRARFVMPQGLTPYSHGYAWFPFTGGRHPEKTVDGIRAATNKLAKFIEAMQKHHNTVGTPIVTGFSQGGALSFALALHHPDLVAAAFPVSGWLPEALRPESKPDGVELPPIVALHGEADALVDIDRAKQAVAQLKLRGFPVKLDQFAGVRHAVPPVVRDRLFALLDDAIEQQAKRAAPSPSPSAGSSAR